VRELACELPDTLIGLIVSFQVAAGSPVDAGAGLRATFRPSMGDNKADSSSARVRQAGPF
jgi:hypothetical protein